MNENDIKYFSKFLEEFQKETDRGAVLVGIALIDDRLERILKNHFLNSKESEDLLNGINAPLGTFSSRNKLAYCLGLITQLELQEIKVIQKVRNLFAHEVHGLTFNDSKVSDFCKYLKANTPDPNRFNNNTRSLFINSVVLTSLALWYRPEHASKYKAEESTWDFQLST